MDRAVDHCKNMSIDIVMGNAKKMYKWVNGKDDGGADNPVSEPDSAGAALPESPVPTGAVGSPGA